MSGEPPIALLLSFFLSFCGAAFVGFALNPYGDKPGPIISSLMMRHRVLLTFLWPMTLAAMLYKSIRYLARDYRETMAAEEAERVKAKAKAVEDALREADEAMRKAEGKR